MPKWTVGAVLLALIAASCSSDGAARTTAAVDTSTSAPATTVLPATTTTTTEPATTTTTAATTTSTEAPADEQPWDVWTLIYASLDTDLHAREHAETMQASTAYAEKPPRVCAQYAHTAVMPAQAHRR